MLKKTPSKKDAIKKLFSELHKAIKKISPKNIECAEYPIYSTYYNMSSDLVFAVVYQRKDFIEIGMNLKKKDLVSGLGSAKHMKYPNISKALIIKSAKDLNSRLKKLIKTSYLNSQADV